MCKNHYAKQKIIREHENIFCERIEKVNLIFPFIYNTGEILIFLDFSQKIFL